MTPIYQNEVKEMPESYALPELSETINQLNHFGSIIAGSFYFAVLALAVIFLIHKVANKFVLPRLANKRYAFVIIFSFYALLLVTMGLLALARHGFDVSVIGRVSLMAVIALAAMAFVIAPYLPALPFKLGHMVEIGGVTGKIAAISPVFTRIQTFDGRTAFVPTTTVWAKNIINYHHTASRRVELQLKVSADHSIADARTVLMDIMKGDTRVLKDPSPLVRTNSISARGLDMVGLCWVENAELLSARSDLYEKVVDVTQSNAGISLVLDSQHVVLSGELTRT